MKSFEQISTLVNPLVPAQIKKILGKKECCFQYQSEQMGIIN